MAFLTKRTRPDPFPANGHPELAGNGRTDSDFTTFGGFPEVRVRPVPGSSRGRSGRWGPRNEAGGDFHGPEDRGGAFAGVEREAAMGLESLPFAIDEAGTGVEDRAAEQPGQPSVAYVVVCRELVSGPFGDMGAVRRTGIASEQGRNRNQT
jgi:hypothetical protein